MSSVHNIESCYPELIKKHCFVILLNNYTSPILSPISCTLSSPAFPYSCAGGGPCTIRALWGLDYVFSSASQAKYIVTYVFISKTTCK